MEITDDRFSIPQQLSLLRCHKAHAATICFGLSYHAAAVTNAAFDFAPFPASSPVTSRADGPLRSWARYRVCVSGLIDAKENCDVQGCVDGKSMEISMDKVVPRRKRKEGR